MEIIQSRAFGPFNDLFVVRAEIPDLVPTNAGAGVIAVGRDLHHRPRPVLIVPAKAADEFFRPAVAPQLDLERLDRMDAELGFLPAADKLRPRVAEQAVRKQPELVRRAG